MGVTKLQTPVVNTGIEPIIPGMYVGSVIVSGYGVSTIMNTTGKGKIYRLSISGYDTNGRINNTKYAFRVTVDGRSPVTFENPTSDFNEALGIAGGTSTTRSSHFDCIQEINFNSSIKVEVVSKMSLTSNPFFVVIEYGLS